MTDRWKVLLPEQIHDAGPESIADIAEFESVAEYGISPEELIPHIDGFDAIILRGAELTSRVLEATSTLKVIAKHGVGLDNVDIETASEKGIVVCNTPSANARSVAEGALALLFATRRNIIQADQVVRDGNWEDAHADWDRFRQHTVEGDVLGLFGFGNTARELARMAQGIGIECVTFDPYISDANLLDGVRRVAEKARLFEKADIISIHTPLTQETRHAIGAEELRQVKYVINTARGEVINESELVQVLENDNLRAAGLDVLSNEPPALDNPLLARDDVVLTPHIAGTSVEALYQMSTQAAENVRTVYEGKLPESTVNKDRLER